MDSIIVFELCIKNNPSPHLIILTYTPPLHWFYSDPPYFIQSVILYHLSFEISKMFLQKYC